jgi:LacI family gluconate utilization system Gnt-I transcriptional repressor
MRGLNIMDQEFSPGGASSVEAGRFGLARLLDRQPALDAIYSPNDDLAIGGYCHSLEHGISIPGQLALFGYNGLEMARLTPQPLSTCP